MQVDYQQKRQITAIPILIRYSYGFISRLCKNRIPYITVEYRFVFLYIILN